MIEDPCAAHLTGAIHDRPGVDFHAEVKRGGNRYPQAILFGYLTSILATPAAESPPELHGTVAQDRLSDRPGHDDGSPTRVDDGEPFAGCTPARPLSMSAYTEPHCDRTATTRHLLQRK